MADLAELEIKIDTSQTVKAKSALDGFSSAAEHAQDSTEKLGKAVGKTRDAQGRFIKGSKDGTAALAAGGKQAQKTSKQYDALGKSTDFAKKQLLALTAALSVVAAIRQAVKVVGDFEQAMATLRGVMRGTTAQMVELEKQAKLMGATTRFSASQAAEAQLALARAGQTQLEILAALPSVLSLASGAQLALGESAGFVSQTLAQFSLDAAEAARVADVFVGVSNRANTDVRQLAEGMKVVGPVAAKMGNTLEGTAAALGVLANAGLQGSLGATALRGALSRLAAPSKEAQRIIERLAQSSGQSVDAFNSSKVSILALFKAFNLAKASTRDLVKVFGQEGLAGALTLIGETKGLEELGKQAQQVSGEAKALADTMNDTLQGAMANLKSATEALFLAVGSSGLAGGFRVLVDALTIVVRGMAGAQSEVGEFSEKAEVVAKVLKTLIFGLKVAAGAFAGMAVQATFAKVAVLGTVASIQALKRAIASTGVGLLVVLLGELAVGLLDGNEAIQQITDNLEGLEKATDAAAKSTDKLTAAQKRARAEAEKAAGPFKALQNQLLELNADIKKTLTAIVGETQGFAEALNLEGIRAYNIVLTEGLRRGLDFAAAQRIAARDSAAFINALAAQREAHSRLADAKSEDSDATKKQIDKISDLQKAYLKLQQQVAASKFIDAATRDLDKLLAKFTALATADGLEGGELISFLEKVRDLFEESAKNKSFARAIDEGRVALKQLNVEATKLEQSNTILSLNGSDTRARVLVEYGDAIRAAGREIEVLLLNEKISTDEAARKNAVLNESVDRIVSARVEQDRLNKANEEAAAALARMSAAQDDLNDAIAAIDFAKVSEFPRSFAEAFNIIVDLEAKAIATGVSLVQLGETVAKVWAQTVLGTVNGVIDSILDRAGDLAITLIFDAETAEETKAAVDAFMKDIQKLLFREIILAPVIDSLKKGVGDLFGGAADQTGDALLVQAGTSLNTAALALQTAAGALHTGAVAQGASAASTSLSASATGLSAASTNIAATQTGAAASQTGAAASQTAAAAGQLSGAASQLASGAAAGAAGGVSGGGRGNVLGAIGGVVGGAVLVGTLGKSIKDARGSDEAAANGAVYADRQLKFAHGGILERPVAFPLRGGRMGIAGEAGPEAILPATRSGGGFAVEADVHGSRMLAQVRRMQSGKMGVRLFAHGGVVGGGPEMRASTSLAQPAQGERRFPTQPRDAQTTRATIVNMTVHARDAGSFKRSEKQIRKGIQRL